MLNMGVAFAAAVVFTVPCDRFRRHRLTTVSALFFMAGYAAYGLLPARPGPSTGMGLLSVRRSIQHPDDGHLLNDSLIPDQAKRMCGLNGVHGLLGGMFGTRVEQIWIDALPATGWIWAGFGIGVAIIMMAAVATAGGNPAVEGARPRPWRCS
jgi:hypothetical protein